jgi:parallel beta-helix repeat protein
VENLRLYNCGEGIYSVGASNNSLIGNYFDKSSIHLMGSEKYIGDLIRHNTFIDMVIFADYNYGGLDVITENNFFNSGILVDLADAPIVDKNYWSDYTAKYPNATEVGSSGIWDTTYINGNSIDYQLLVNPITDFEFWDFSNFNSTPTTLPSPSTSTTPTVTSTPTQTPTPTASFSPSPTPTSGTQTTSPTLLWVVLIVLLVAILVAAIVFMRKRFLKRK